MKHLFLLVIALLGCIRSNAQTDKEASQYFSTPAIQFEEQTITINNGAQPALKVVITGNEDHYGKHLKQWFEKSFGLEGKRGNGMIVLPGAVITAWSMDSLNVMYRIEKDADKCALFLLAAKKNIYLNQKDHPAEINAIQQSL
ncbi:MAG: hypothetical protein RLZZ262_215, partial [Bacteroidota bacterium]